MSKTNKEERKIKGTYYDKKCLRCGHIETYVLTSEFANVGINVPDALSRLKEYPFDYNWCEKCNMITRNEFVGYFEIKRSTTKGKE